MIVDQEDTLPQGLDGDEDSNAKLSVPFEDTGRTIPLNYVV